ncbi:MAG TPA: hypothetical protein PLX97_00665 [Gemmatales bacterium]|nr:hypothetical protein [Gemmatales bacterium]
MVIAVKTRKRQVVDSGNAAVLFSNDMVNFEKQTGSRFWKMTILTPISGPFSNNSSQASIHSHYALLVLSVLRARACSMSSKQAICSYAVISLSSSADNVPCLALTNRLRMWFSTSSVNRIFRIARAAAGESSP